MKSNCAQYNYLKSFERLDKIINGDYTYEEINNIPSRDKLTFDNGFYVNCSAMFVDIRGSSQLPDIHKRPTLAKLYRAYVSEIVALVNGNSTCIEVNIVGDCVSSVFDTPYKEDINDVFGMAAKISSLIKVMNYKFEKNGIETIKVGIGISYGRALMIKAGYNGSGINEIVWMGDVVNKAANLGNYGSKDGNKMIVVSPVFYNNLYDSSKALLEANNFHKDYYHGNVINTEMEEWFCENCK